MIVRIVASLLLGCVLVFNLSAEDDDALDEILDYLKDKAFTVHLVIRLLDANEVIVWDVEHTDVTVSGRALNVRLVGEDIVIDAFLTPFGSFESSVMIVAYGQLWFTDGTEEGVDEESVKYESFMKSVPVEPGEPVLFFPLGVAVDSETNTLYTIQLEIQLLPYQDDAAGAEQSE